MASEGLRERIEFGMFYKLNELYKNLEHFRTWDQSNEIVRSIKESIEKQIGEILMDADEFRNCHGNLSRFYEYLYELDDNYERRLIRFDDILCRDLSDI